MILNKLFLLQILCIINSQLICGKTIQLTVDPKTDYEFHDIDGSDTTPDQQLMVNGTTGRPSEVEAEENVVNPVLTTETEPAIDPNNDKPVRPTESPDTSGTDSGTCNLKPELFAIKITELLEKYIPDSLILKPITRGNSTRIRLENGKLTIARQDYKPMGQPVCRQPDDQTYKYDITVLFTDLMGVYEWKVKNLFGYDFGESAFITIKEMVIELVIAENKQQKSRLDEIRVGKIDGLKVRVNIPERIASNSFLKPMLEYVISRLSTTVANEESQTTTTTTTTTQSLLVSDIISDEMLFDTKPMQPIDTNSLPKPKWKCSLDDQDIKAKITDILSKFVPTLLRLRPIQRGNSFRVTLNNGKLTINKDFKIMGQPVCQELDDQSVKYRIRVLFDNLMGVYDWKIHNLFGMSFAENIRQLEMEFEVRERTDGRNELSDMRVDRIDGFKVDVNIPDNIIGVRLLKRMIKFFVSRVSTLVANRSVDSIKRHIYGAFFDSIKNKIQLNFNVVKEKLVFS
ncbi:unnamed protein product [Medioppia subpectinata]|uniref:Uncharacterized protein n=1 Tax=Medioppia subpectinata TaxID=1979941 RepID=A0A7R9Q497_9ACAR|nr:unnamed protein product [Medioppia subpectinata]CAG2112057.1 unnamed protein product [Medioppia subpectinata]